MIFFIRIFAFIFALSASAIADEKTMLGTNIHVSSDYEILIIYLDEEPEHEHFFLSDPHRLVIDFEKLDVEKSPDLESSYKGELIKDIRYGVFEGAKSRLVLDLNKEIILNNVFAVKKKGNKPFRLVFEIAAADGGDGVPKQTNIKTAKSKTLKKPTPSAKPKEISAADVFIPKPIPKPASIIKAFLKPKVIIDAGHGGKDPGAISRSGKREKDITLRYTRALAAALKATGRYNVELTRSTDRFIMLRDRVDIARKKGGDIFISLHADSAPRADARGLSIYTLSEEASDAEAAALAEKENKADFLGDVEIAKEYEEVADILIDLVQRDTKNKSSELADTLIAKLKNSIKLLRNTHRYAGFAVLKAPDIPSVLIELGFLSNKTDEKLLQTKSYQDLVVRGLVKGIDSYFNKNKIAY